MYRRVAQHAFKYHRNFSSVSAVPSPIPNPPLPNTGIFINNEYQKARSGEIFETINPATEQVITQVQRSRKEDVDLAVQAAADAFKLGSPWRTMDASQRGRLLYKLADLMERDEAILASLESIDGGIPFTFATYFTQFAMSCLRYYAGFADKHHGKTIPMDGNFFVYTKHEPVGVCGQIIPWNGPLLMFCGKIAPALAMGNTVVVKPAELTPLTALHMGKLIVEAGIPPGVVNIVPGYGDAGEAICRNAKVDKIAFTGSTSIGMKIQEAAGVGNLKRTTLELGGKSPNIILDDVDVATAVEWAHQAVNMNQGQACIAGSRMFVQASIYDDFVQKSAERAQRRVVGDPFDPKTEQGPQISAAQAEKIQNLVNTGVKEGAALVTGGSRFGDKGFFFQPTVFAEVQDHHTIAKEEIFGPVQQLIRFNTLEELIDRANDTPYGLGAGIFTKDVDKINYLSQGIRSGMVWVNCYAAAGPQVPFGGFKNSGLGREMGEDGLHQYTEIKTVVTAIPQKNSSYYYFDVFVIWFCIFLIMLLIINKANVSISYTILNSDIFLFSWL